MNKKGSIITSLTSNFVYAIIILIIFLIVLGSGGGLTLIKVTSTLSQLPTFVWIILGVIVLFSLIRKK